MSGVQELRARRAELLSQIKACAAEKKLAARDMKAYNKRAEALWAVPPDIMMDALRLYAACEWNLLPAVTFLRRVGGQRRWPSLGNPEIENLVEDAFLECDVQSLLSELRDTRARTCLKEWQLASYCIGANANGVAPTTAQMLERAGSLAQDAPSIACRTTSQRPARNARKWASRPAHLFTKMHVMHCCLLFGRFRKRWGARYGKVKWASSVCDAIRRQKVLRVLLEAGARCENRDAVSVLGMRARIKLRCKSLRMRSQNGLR